MFPKFTRSIALLGMVSVSGIVIAWMLFIVGRPDPSVNYLAELNAEVEQIPDSQKAWNIYRDVWAEYQFCEGLGGHFQELLVDDGISARLVQPEDAEWASAIKKLEDSTSLLESLRAGARAPHLGLVLQTNLNDYSLADRAALFPDLPAEGPIRGGMGVAGVAADVDVLMAESMMNMLLPHIQSFRKAARILIVDSRYANQQGDTERIVKNIESIMGLSQQAADSNLLICKLVGLSVERLGFELLDELLAKHSQPFTQNQLVRLQEAIQRVIQGFDFSLSGERILMLDMIQRVYTNNGQGDGRITKQGLAILDISRELLVERIGGGRFSYWLANKILTGPIALFSIATRRETTQQMEDWLLSTELKLKSPVYEKTFWDNLGAEVRQAAIKHPILGFLFPDSGGIHQNILKARASRTGASMALAVYQYRVRNGQWPASADALLDGFLESLPLDPQSGKPLKYSRQGDGFVIYGVGLDGEDNGGFRPRLALSGRRPDVQIGIQEWSRENDWIPEPTSQYQYAQKAQKGTDHVVWPRKGSVDK